MSKMTDENQKPLLKKTAAAAATATAPMPTPEDSAPGISPATSHQALAALAVTANRRDDIAPKEMSDVQVLDPSANVIARADAMPKETAQFIFMSRYPLLTMYVPVKQRSDFRIDFKNGVFATSDADIAAGMRMHPRFGRLFREEASVRTAAIRAEAARQREGMRTPTFSGATTSVDGSEQVFFGADRTLADLERRAIETGSVE